MCSSITLCFKMRLGSGDSGHLSTLLVQPAAAQHQPLRSLVWDLISISRQDSRKEQPIWCRTTSQMLRAGTGRVKPSLPPACPPAALASAAWNPWGPVGPSRQPDGQQRQERRRSSSGNRPQGTPGQGGEGKRGTEGGERTAVWHGSPTGRAEKAGPFFFSRAGRQGHLRALELWGVQGTGHCAQPASAWEPALGVKPYPVLAPAPLSFFLIRSNQSESEEPSFLLGSV